MKHIFLTGEIQVGKSTIINKICTELSLAPQGFKTIAINCGESGADYLYILPYNLSEPMESDKPFAKRNRNERKREGFPEVFDELGVKILRESMINQDTNIMVMDELGFFENEAYAFQNEIIKCLDGTIPILGVIKPHRTEFLDRVRSHNNVEIIEVTLENRDDIYISVLESSHMLIEKQF